MTIETATYINQLDATYPASGDAKSEGDNHLRLLKSTIKATFPNLTATPVTPTSAELNYVAGVTSAVQTQLTALVAVDATKAPLASPALTGTPTAPTATLGTGTTQLATTAFVQAAALGGTFAGTLADLNASITDADVASLAGVETLTNKTLTSPALTTPALGTPSSGTLTNCTADGTNAVGFRHIPQISQSAAYTLVLTDAGKHILHPSADTTARIFTIPANSSVAFPIGTAVTFVNQNAGGVITIAITTDTLRLAGAGTTGSRTLAANGVATAIKLTSTEWIISGGSSLT